MAERFGAKTQMTLFYSPYQFIPIDTSKTQDKVEWQPETTLNHRYIRHDAWADDGISAIIHCKVTTLSPLAIGNFQAESTEKIPSIVTPYSHANERPAIPANSLRGMIASVAETMSQSAMRVFTAEKKSHYAYTSASNLLGKDSLPWNSSRTHLTPAEAIFGVVEESIESEAAHRNLASRVRFNDAVAEEGVTFSSPITLKKLDSPKPPSPAMYYSAANGEFISKDDLKNHKPNGRKHYLPHSNNAQEAWKTAFQYEGEKDAKDQNWKQHLQIRPVPANSFYHFTLNVENLSPAEFGLLLTALEPAQDNNDFIHRLGLGKPYGLGQITLDIDKIECINRKNSYSLQGLTQPRLALYSDDKGKRNTKLIDTIAWQELQTLANPQYSKDYPVCYPFTTKQGAYSEEEGYQWFGTNEKEAKDYLKKITIGKALKPLESN
ncbi:MAG: hypothetical protein KAH22_08925 [Thiotrichaceae bacterium]|nr:hypothetical protein [Thiotrichaceae bacterium]